MNVIPASQNSFTAAIRLLENCGLPTADLNPGHQLFVIEDRSKVIGTVVVEYDYKHALLRSLSVAEEYRNKDIGKQLVAFIEDYVRKQGVQTIYIITTTAPEFFSKKNYQKTERNEVPEFIQHTSEFSSICPSSATIMKKDLL